MIWFWFGVFCWFWWFFCGGGGVFVGFFVVVLVLFSWVFLLLDKKQVTISVNTLRNLY